MELPADHSLVSEIPMSGEDHHLHAEILAAKLTADRATDAASLAISAHRALMAKATKEIGERLGLGDMKARSLVLDLCAERGTILVLHKATTP